MSKLILLIGAFLGLFSFSLVGCVSHTSKRVLAAVERGELCKAIEVYESEKEPDLSLLGKIAEALLEREAKASDKSRREAAFAQLRLAGTGARRVLQRLAEGKSASIPRAEALRLLSDLGDENAKEALRELAGSTDPEILAVALASLDLETEKKRVLSALQSKSSEVRRKAAQLLAGLSSETEVRIALIKSVKQDPDPKVRSAAITSLTQHAAESSEIIEQMVLDPNLSVRLAAVRALIRTDSGRAAPILGKYLDTEASDEGVEVARVLIAERGTDRNSLNRALRYLYRALSASDPTVRAHAAVALDGLPVDWISTEKIRAHMEKEEIPMVKLPLAMTLLSRPEARGAVARALLELMKEGGVEGVQAAAERAALGDRKALRRLFRLRSDPSVLIRRVAVRLISRKLGHPDEAGKSLCDDDPIVRIIAAGAILSVLASDG